MRVLGICLLIIGIVMMAITGFNFTTEKKVVDAGPIQINKEENHHVGWPLWAGAVAAVSGVIIIVADRKK